MHLGNLFVSQANQLSETKRNKGKLMNYAKQSSYINCTLLASKIGRVLDLKYLESDECDEQEIRDLQDILIEDYNLRLKRKG